MKPAKELPILCNSETVRAILARRKTQTRRPLVVPSQHWDKPLADGWGWVTNLSDDYSEVIIGCTNEETGEGAHLVNAKNPFGKPRDLLYVQEHTLRGKNGSGVYSADNTDTNTPWWHSRPTCPAIHMPKHVSRLLLRLTDVKVGRVQNITDRDAIAEGAVWAGGHQPSPKVDWFDKGGGCPRACFASRWDSIYDKEGLGWDTNPLVVVREFKIQEIQGND